VARNSPKGPTPVDSIKHGETRKNIPTADAQDFVTPEIEAVRKVRFQRDETLDPQLIWRGKYPDVVEGASDIDSDLVTDAPPIYIQEKIDPRVLVENLRRTAARPDDEPELALFDSFDGLDELEQIDFYQHDANWSNRMILGDSLQVMASLAEREHLRGKVQMVYIDPPYGIKFNSNWQFSVRNRDVRDGRLEDAAREVEQIKAFRDTWASGIHSYLGYLRDRLLAASEMLTDSGSCFVQIGDDNVHLVRSLMDEVFGAENFVSIITLKKSSGATTEFLGATTDFLIWYAKNRDVAKFRKLFKVKDLNQEVAGYDIVELPDGTRRRMTADERASLARGELVGRRLQMTILTSQSAGREKGEGAASWFPVEVDGRTFRPSMTARWKTSEAGMARLLAAGRVGVSGNNLRYVRYVDDFPAVAITNLWEDVQQGSGSEKIYVVQTGGNIVERCMLMCTDPGDIVLDPTCGSGTTAHVAEQWGRRWITIDTSRVALALARQRIMASRYPWYLLADSAEGHAKERALSAHGSRPSTFSNDIRQGFVYERVPHIMLKSIANNPDIKDGMTPAEIDAAIKRHSDSELLFDKPYEDPRKVRVAGPFTFESLSPHRAVSFKDVVEPLAESEAAKLSDGANFEQSILENLAKAGIQNGKRSEKLKFEAFETYAGQYIQAVGQQVPNGEHAAPSRIGIAVGPQYGTVSAKYVKDAAREAIRAEDIDLLCVLGFAFDPQATNVTEGDGFTIEASDEGFAQIEGARNVGRLPVLMVRMNADLLMGEELKKTGSGNLFTVFGEPDIDLRSTDDGYIVDLRGVDIYDPTTGEVRSSDTGQIALWMIDTDYNEESFFVRHCYFTGGNDPYKRLKTALKADVDADAWESLYQTISRPFPKPSTGKIAVKVINDYGDEVMKVFEA
jgi:adenine-specific DNA-methyltransferase